MEAVARSRLAWGLGCHFRGVAIATVLKSEFSPCITHLNHARNVAVSTRKRRFWFTVEWGKVRILLALVLVIGSCPFSSRIEGSRDVITYILEKYRRSKFVRNRVTLNRLYPVVADLPFPGPETRFANLVPRTNYMTPEGTRSGKHTQEKKN
ncbi:hypothetical protein F4823DRAFT_427050 [Ustulina deusta]|nr:hypothetical protein F4823DRAFT_427050 [Ustulina deusta]